MKITHFVPLVMLLFAYAAPSQQPIRSIDFKNFTYDAYCAGEDSETVTVKDGEYSYEKQEDGWVDRVYFKIFNISYGDLTGDGRDEAVVLSVCNTGGTGNFSEGYIFTLKGGKPVQVAHIPGGDRAYGGLREARVENGLLVVESNDVGELGGACCPEFVVTSRYRLSGDKLVKVGVSDRRELYPAERVRFDRGASGKTFKIKIPSQDIKRLAVGARAGQTLMVSIDTDKASLRLLEEAQVTEGINNFVARLPKTGDYTIEIQNSLDTEAVVTVNIKIN